MKQFILVIQIIISIIFIFLILIQSKGKGLGSAFGSSSQSSFSRRGLEKMLYKFTFVIAGLFVIVSILALSL